MKSSLALAFLSLVLGCDSAVGAVEFDWAFVGNPGNAGELSGLGTGGLGPDAVVGAVAYSYKISKTAVTNTQYAEFLNAVAASDSYGLFATNSGEELSYGIVRSGLSGGYTYTVRADAVGKGPGGSNYSYADKPVIFTDWYDTIRFTNWLHNGQDNGDTEAGAYTLQPGSTGADIARNSDAAYWLPSEDEWYKAAYHDASAGTAGVYFDYATGTNLSPDNSSPSDGTGNSANFFDGQYTNSRNYSLTDVGAYGSSESPYGTFDQNGNVWEWHETWHEMLPLMRGGSWASGASDLTAAHRDPNTQFRTSTVGFRVATLAIPEPSTLLLMASLAIGGLASRCRLK